LPAKYAKGREKETRQKTNEFFSYFRVLSRISRANYLPRISRTNNLEEL